MADFGGFNIETPQEVLARVREQRAKALQSDDQITRLMAIQDQAFDSIFGNPDVNRAERRVKDIASAVSEAMGELPDNASDIERQRARLRAIQGVLETQDPAAALQIQQQLLDLDSEEFERSRLLAKDERDTEAHAARMEEHQLKMTQLKQQLDREQATEGIRQVLYGTMANPQVATFDVNTEEGRQALQQFLEDTPDAYGPLTPERAAMIRYGQEKDGGSKVNSHEAREFRKEVDTSIRTLTFANQYLSVLREDPRAFTTGARLSAKADGLLRNVESMAHAMISTARNLGGYGEYYDANGNVGRINDFLAERGITDARLQGLAVNLAYSLAKQLDENGRLSDQDVELAIRMLGGSNPSAEAVAAAVKDNVGISARLTLDKLIRTDPVLFARDIAQLEMQWNEFNTLADSFSERKVPKPSTEEVIQQEADRKAGKPGRTPAGRIRINGGEVGF